MRDSKSPAVQLVFRILGALAVFIILDTAIFRTSLYSQFLSPDSIVGTATHYLKYERQRETSHRRDVLVIGDSQVGEGFWAGLANRNESKNNLFFVQGAIPGATLRVLYFYQRILDPNRDRYKAIVICLPTFRRMASTEAEHLNDRMLDADFLIPVVSSRDFLEFSRTFTTEEKRIEVGSRVLVQSLSYQMDFQNFILHPITRKRLLSWRRRIKENFALEYSGREENLQGLTYNSGTGEIHFPERLAAAERAQLTEYLTNHGTVNADHYDEYSRQWIERFIEQYRGSKTTLVFVRLPSEVLPQGEELRRNGPFASYMPLLQNDPAIQVMDEEAFYNLEDPRFFFDTLHMNSEGRREFTNRLSSWLAKVLHQSA